MNAEDELIQYAEILVGIADKKYLSGNQMTYYFLLTGTENCKLESVSEAGQNYQVIVDAIHNYYKSHPYSEIIQGYLSGMKFMVRQIKSMTELQNFLHVFFYELEKEIKGESAFPVPVWELLLSLKQSIKTYHLESIWNSYAGMAKEKYGISL